MRKGKEELYEKEREDILIKVLKLIGIDKNNNRILRENLEKPEIKEYINEMMEEIKKYYSISRWRSVYRKENKELNIIKNLMRENMIDILKIEKKRIKEDGKYEGYRIYIFEIPEEIKIKL
jgi:hypothetical protein